MVFNIIIILIFVVILLVSTAIIRDVVKSRAAEYFKLEESQRDAERIAAAAQVLLNEQLKEDNTLPASEGAAPAEGGVEVS